jgi:hypothetical protein
MDLPPVVPPNANSIINPVDEPEINRYGKEEQEVAMLLLAGIEGVQRNVEV